MWPRFQAARTPLTPSPSIGWLLRATRPCTNDGIRNCWNGRAIVSGTSGRTAVPISISAADTATAAPPTPASARRAMRARRPRQHETHRADGEERDRRDQVARAHGPSAVPVHEARVEQQVGEDDRAAGDRLRAEAAAEEHDQAGQARDQPRRAVEQAAVGPEQERPGHARIRRRDPHEPAQAAVLLQHEVVGQGQRMTERGRVIEGESDGRGHASRHAGPACPSLRAAPARSRSPPRPGSATCSRRRRRGRAGGRRSPAVAAATPGSARTGRARRRAGARRRSSSTGRRAWPGRRPR